MLVKILQDLIVFWWNITYHITDIYVVELKKLPPEQNEEPLIIKWMRFLSAESREDFEKMAGEDTYINEAYEVLQKLSADERKRLEYEAR